MNKEIEFQYFNSVYMRLNTTPTSSIFHISAKIVDNEYLFNCYQNIEWKAVKHSPNNTGIL